jgi:hypothetical protein
VIPAESRQVAENGKTIALLMLSILREGATTNPVDRFPTTT